MPDPLNDITRELRLASIESIQSDISVANNIIIGGGGAVGVEVASDIKLRNPDKKVTLIHSRDSVVNSMPKKMQSFVLNQLNKIGVEVILNERVLEHKQKVVSLKSGKTLECDIYIPASSIGGNSAFMPEGTTDERSFIKVNEFLQTEKFRNIFAIGDCSNYSTVKIYPVIEDQIPTIINNINAYLENKDLKAHDTSFMVYILFFN
jgi:NADH dehydrogenase FAD-containing subunit